MAMTDRFEGGIKELFDRPNFDPNATVGDDSWVDYDAPEVKKYDGRKTRNKVIGSLTVLAIAGAAWNMGDFAWGYFSTLLPRQTIDGNILAPGQASVEKVNLNITTVPVAEYTTQIGNPKNNTGALEVGISKNITSQFVNFPYQDTIIDRMEKTQQTTSINTKYVHLNFDAMDDDLTISVPSIALTSEIHTVPGSAATVDGSNWNLLPGVDQINDLANEISGGLKVIGIGSGNASEVPGAGLIANSVTKTHSDLENYADLTILKGVDQECTPKVANIPGFTKGMKINIVGAVRGMLLDANFTNSPQNADLQLLVNRPTHQLQEIVDKAHVVFTSDNSSEKSSSDYTIAPDQNVLDAYKTFTQSAFYKTLGKEAIVCSVKNAKLIEPKGDAAPATSSASEETKGGNK
jgi:hypothetical protein